MIADKVQANVIVDYINAARDVYNEITPLVENGIIPNIGIDLSFCEELVVSVIRDTAEDPLKGVLRMPTMVNSGEFIKARAELFLAKGVLTNSFSGEVPNEIKGFFGDDSVIGEVLGNYSVNRDRMIMQRSKKLKFPVNPMYFSTIADSCVEHVRSEESQTFIDNLLCVIDDLGTLNNLKAMVRSKLGDNPYEVWSIMVYKRQFCLLQGCGDYRIIQWHKQNDKQ